MQSASSPAGLSRLRRALLVGWFPSSTQVGGLQIAFEDLAAQLSGRDWVTSRLAYDLTPAEEEPSAQLAGMSYRASPLARLQRWQVALRLWEFLPNNLRDLAATLAMPKDFYKEASSNLHRLDARLKEPGQYDLVILGVDGSTPGMVALALDRHPRVALVSLLGLAREFRADWWPWLRPLARRLAGPNPHPYLFQQALPGQVSLAIFASRHWQTQAIQAGLPSSTARTVYLGVPVPPEPRPSWGDPGRLLWVGRLSREKGLHLFLEALPRIRELIPGISLTVVAGQGSPGYRQLVAQLIRRHGLRDVVDIRPPVNRERLPDLYATHEMLLFHSVYPEPVALVMMEAMASGLPVVASRPPRPSELLEEGVTCLCYDPERIDSIAEAVVRAHKNAGLRQALAAHARSRILGGYSLNSMGSKFDRVLREFTDGRPA